MNQSINYEAVCRTAPATPGLLIILEQSTRLLRAKGISFPCWIDGAVAVAEEVWKFGKM